MTLSLTLDAEQTAALDDMLADFNRHRDEPLTAKAYLETVLAGCINDRVRVNFETAAQSLVAAAKSAPYEQRLALIALVQSQLTAQ
jgi:hypothetical protein